MDDAELEQVRTLWRAAMYTCISLTFLCL